MVFYFVAKDGTLMYMGKDKFENEDLIKYGWPEDVWFHVDNLSSAHVYVRLAPGKTMDDIPEDVVRDCAQLVKENSIEGVKKASVTVIYTPWSNLRKDGSMAVRWCTLWDGAGAMQRRSRCIISPPPETVTDFCASQNRSIR